MQTLVGQIDLLLPYSRTYTFSFAIACRELHYLLWMPTEPFIALGIIIAPSARRQATPAFHVRGLKGAPGAGKLQCRSSKETTCAGKEALHHTVRSLRLVDKLE